MRHVLDVLRNLAQLLLALQKHNLLAGLVWSKK